MSLKYSSTTADYLQWSEAMNLIRKLARDSNYKMSLLIALGIHDLMMHDYGPGRKFLTLHVEVDCNDNIMAVHDAMDLIERSMLEKYHILTTIHMDPVDTNDALTNELKQVVLGVVKRINKEYSIHDFRIVTGPTHTNLIFDVMIPSNDEIKHKVLKEEVIFRA